MYGRFLRRNTCVWSFLLVLTYLKCGVSEYGMRTGTALCGAMLFSPEELYWIVGCTYFYHYTLAYLTAGVGKQNILAL